MIGRHPRLRFQCFLASRHANQSLCTLARELPNLSLAGYWWHNFFPDAIAQVIRERLDMLPAEQAGRLLLRRLLRRVGLRQGRPGAQAAGAGARRAWSSGASTRLAEALAIARAILFESPQSLLGMVPRLCEGLDPWKPPALPRSSMRWGRSWRSRARTRFVAGRTTTPPSVAGDLPADLSEMIADGSLEEVPGIGETMHAKIVQLATTGQLPAYDKLREAMSLYCR